VIGAGRAMRNRLLAIPLRELGICFPSRKPRQQQAQAWFSKVDLSPRSGLQHTPQLAVS
jgi:hypothetical protein